MSDGSQRTILVVEDDEGLRRLVALILCHHGYEVLEAGTASEGSAIMRGRGPEIALAILDMVLPDRSGLDLAAELDRDHPGVKVLYISGYIDSLAMEVIRHHSPDVVLLKPFTAVPLIDRVSRLLGEPNPSPLPWDRLVEASDSLDSGAVVMTYKDTAVGFAVAAAHAAVLREAGMDYSFRTTARKNYDFELVVPRETLRRVRELAASVGLGADIAPAA